MTRKEFLEKKKAACRQHERTMQAGASWYCWIYTQLQMARGRTRSRALELALKRHPRAWEHIDRRLCDTSALLNSYASAALASRAANATPSVRTVAGSSSSIGAQSANSR